jgi:hypothetical protein
MKENTDVEKFRTFMAGLSSSIVLIILFGLFACVLIYHTFILNLTTLGITDLQMWSIIIGLANTVGIGYIVTQLIRVQAGVNELKNKN